jgi:polyisoprenoid-binding protein YceI
MMIRRVVFAAAVLAALGMPALILQAQPAAAPAEAPVTAFVPESAGTYALDKSHANIIFSVTHLGFSNYFGRFNNFDGTLVIDAAAPENSKVDITIDTASLDTNHDQLEGKLKNAPYFNVAQFPTATFKSTSVRVSPGTNTGVVVGELTLLGVTKPVTLDVVFNRQALNPFSKKQTVGFSAKGTFKRSEFGMTELVPHVGDDVTLQIEVEFGKQG